MTEFWISKDKYFCKYCKIYIADDKPSRTLHETGLKHKGNLERYIRDVYKQAEVGKREAAVEAREIARMNAAAGIGTGPVASTSRAAPPPARPARPSSASTSSDPFRNYSSAASLGIVDEEGDRLAAEANKFNAQGNIGAWEIVVKPPKAQLEAEQAEKLRLEREAKEEQEEIQRKLIEERTQRFLDRPSHLNYLQVKTSTLDGDDAYDPSKLGTRLKRQKLTVKEEEELVEAEEKLARLKKEESMAARGPGGWNEVAHEAQPILQFEVESEVKPEIALPVKEEAPPVEEGVPVAPSVFKKRKLAGNRKK